MRMIQSQKMIKATHSFMRIDFSPWILCLLFFCFDLIIQSYRITFAPDLFADEGAYYVVGRNLAAGLGLTQIDGTIFVWHPPLYMLLQAMVLKLFGLVDADPVVAILHLRLINVTASAFTAALLFLIGYRLKGRRTGVVIALLFCLDPYVQRINRRNMIETVAMLLVVLGVYLYMSQLHAKRYRITAAVLIGFVCGLAILTKEVMAVGLVILLCFALLFQREHLKQACVSAATAFAVYSVYPIWLFMSGSQQPYLDMKVSQLFRFVARLVYQTSTEKSDPATASANAPLVTGGSISFWQSASINLVPYAFSYITLLVAAGLALLLLIGRRSQEERLIATWLIVLYAFIGVGVVAGKISDQFFYYLIVPALVVVGYVIAKMIEHCILVWTDRRPLHRARRFTHSGILSFFVVWVALVGLDWNVSVYTNLYIFGQDNIYVDLTKYIKTHIPPGTLIEFGNDLSNYLLPQYQLRFDRDGESIRNYQARYFVLSTKEAWGNYVDVTPELYSWVESHSDVHFEQYGNTYWNVKLFKIRPPEVSSP